MRSQRQHGVSGVAQASPRNGHTNISKIGVRDMLKFNAYRICSLMELVLGVTMSPNEAYYVSFYFITNAQCLV